MLLKLKSSVIYGPVNSRRLGRSLGINILPSRKKVCTFNCLYCQYGLWDSINPSDLNGVDFPAVDTILREVDKALSNLSPRPAYITFSGHGEATLHPSFPEIVDGLNQVREYRAPSAKTAILSNSTMVHVPEVRSALAKLDVRIMKLDAGNRHTFSRYNIPHKKASFNLETIYTGLSLLKEIIIQSLFTAGPGGNFSEAHVRDWVTVLKRINPSSVQIYSLKRSAPSPAVIGLERKDLLELQLRLERENINAEIF